MTQSELQPWLEGEADMLQSLSDQLEQQNLRHPHALDFETECQQG